MKSMALLKTSLIATVIFAVVCCIIYPLLVFGIGQLLFHEKANGSLVYDKSGNQVIGSKLIAQSFKSDGYFHPRPSAAGKDGYDASNSSGSNLGPTSQKLFDTVKSNIDEYRTVNGLSEFMSVPIDAVTASASGLDPHISKENAHLQIPRVAKARNLSEAEVMHFVKKNTKHRTFGLLGESRVNVFLLNQALDEVVSRMESTPAQ